MADMPRAVQRTWCCSPKRREISKVPKPPKVACQPVPTSGSMPDFQRLERTDPKAQLAAPARMLTAAKSCVGPSVRTATRLGQSSTTIPTMPSNRPTVPREDILWWPMSLASRTRNQSGEMATSRAESPVEMYCSAQESVRFPPTSSRIPMEAWWNNCCGCNWTLRPVTAQ